MDNEDDRTIDLLSEWLQNNETQKLLGNIAKSVLNESFCNALPFLQPYMSKPEKAEEIKSELNIFILEKSKFILAKKKLLGDHHFFTSVRRMFLNGLMDKYRRKDNTPWQYLFKRITPILKNPAPPKRFFTHRIPGQQYSAYSINPENISILLSNDDIRSIPFPDKITDRNYDSINNEKTIVKLAEFFWNQVSQMWNNKSVWISVRDFSNWLNQYIMMAAPNFQNEPLIDGGVHFNVISNLAADPTNNPIFYSEKVRQWAEIFSNCLTGDEKIVFLCRYDPDNILTLKEIALKFHFKNENRVKYLLTCAELKLKDFVRDKDWLNPDDKNEEAISLFYQTLIEILKKSVFNP